MVPGVASFVDPTARRSVSEIELSVLQGSLLRSAARAADVESEAAARLGRRAERSANRTRRLETAVQRRVDAAQRAYDAAVRDALGEELRRLGLESARITPESFRWKNGRIVAVVVAGTTPPTPAPSTATTVPIPAAQPPTAPVAERVERAPIRRVTLEELEPVAPTSSNGKD